MNLAQKFMVCLLFFLTMGLGLAFDPSEGTEVVLTDLQGTTLLGYGLIESQTLAINLSEKADVFLMLIVSPNGDFETLEGRVSEGGEILIGADRNQNLSEHLLKSGISLEVTSVVEEVFKQDQDDESVEPQKPSTAQEEPSTSEPSNNAPEPSPTPPGDEEESPPPSGGDEQEPPPGGGDEEGPPPDGEDEEEPPPPDEEESPPPPDGEEEAPPPSDDGEGPSEGDGEGQPEGGGDGGSG